MAVIRELGHDELGDWDAAAVDAPGGHVLQSRAWAEHRAGQGWEPRFLATGDVRALALVRAWPMLGGGSAYVPRGPVGAGTPWTDRAAGQAIGTGLAALARHLGDRGVDVVAADPEVADENQAYRTALDAASFHRIPDIQPSRHRMAIELHPGCDEAAVLAGVAKATRQRIRRAERDGVIVVRHDASPQPVDGLVAARESPEVALARFYDLLRATGERRGFGFGGPGEFVSWWVRALRAGHLVLLEAHAAGEAGGVLGGLVLYRHGRRLSTAHSADDADRRHSQPGTMHLLRWRAIQLALAEDRSQMDLGGVDVPGARRPPEPGEPTFGLYEHKRSFGARWVALAGAWEAVIRPWRYALGRGVARADRALGHAGSG